MKKIKRYIGVIALIITISLMLIGCGQVKINSEVSINIDGTSSTRLKIYYDDTINKLVDNDLLSKVISKINNIIYIHISCKVIFRINFNSVHTISPNA